MTIGMVSDQGKFPFDPRFQQCLVMFHVFRLQNFVLIDENGERDVQGVQYVQQLWAITIFLIFSGIGDIIYGYGN